MLNKTEEEIIKNWKGDIQKPLITVCAITFNHEKFIEQAIDSFLMQETNFPFEILIHDDASTDDTANIIRQYEEKYPKMIKPVYQSENQYSKGIRAISPIFLFPKAKGKYITLCEGDDYWRGKLKLQQQVDFLEQNSNYSICYHNSIVVDEDNHIVSPIKNTEPKDYSQDAMLLGETFILTNTIMFRSFSSEALKNYQEKYREVFNGDMALMHQLGFMGKCKYMEEIEYAAYRVHSGGVWSSINELKKIDNLYKSKRVLEENLTHRPDLIEKMEQSISRNFAVSLSRILIAFDFKSYKKVLSIIHKDSKLSLSSIFTKHMVYMFERIFARVPVLNRRLNL